MSATTQRPTTATAVAPAPATRGTRIALDGVCKDYGLATPAVDHVDLVIEPGEFMTLLGPSGSGKTTTLNLIAGFETLTSGAIHFDGADVSRLPPHKRNLGMLFQNYALFPHMTVAQNVAYPLRQRKVGKAEIARRVAEVLELVQLPGRDDHHPSQLSGGQQQRVALARAIVFDPTALLLDEPLGALDRNLRGALQAEIHRIHQEVGTTFVFVTHDQEEAMNLSDRISLFHDGRIEQVGTPEALYRRPETLFAAQFLGDSIVFPLESGPRAGDSKVTWRDEVWHLGEATVAGRATAGEPAALVVRPEDVVLTDAPHEAPAGVNTLEVAVRALEYMGPYRTAVLDLGDGRTGRARLGPGDTRFTVGRPVTAWWRPDAHRVVGV